MLQEHVQPCRRGAGLAPDRVEQVRLGVAQVGVDEAAVLQGQGGPAKVAGERLRQVGAEQGGGLPVVGENGAKELVVRSLHVVGHRPR